MNELIVERRPALFGARVFSPTGIPRMGSETDGPRYQAAPGSWRSPVPCFQWFPGRCGIGVAISEEIVASDRVVVARVASGGGAPYRGPSPRQGRCGVPFALTGMATSTTMERSGGGAVEVSNGVPNGGFEPRTRDTPGGVRKGIPIPDRCHPGWDPTESARE